LKLLLETPIGFIEPCEINNQWFSYFLNEIKLGEENIDIFIRSLKRFLQGIKPTDPNDNRVFTYYEGESFISRHLFNLGAPHAAMYIRYYENQKMDLFFHQAHHPTDIRKVLCEITDEHFQKWAETLGVEYLKIKPCHENTVKYVKQQ